MGQFTKGSFCASTYLPTSIHLEIQIKQHYTYKVYTSGSSIDGEAIIKSECDVSFGSLEVCFIGVTTTRNFIQPNPIHMTKPFMKMCMPTDQKLWPTGKVFKAGKVYTIPFHFVVPDQLVVSSCRHNCDNDAIRDRHLRLPPSMGLSPGCDQAPQEAEIRYSIMIVATKKCHDLPVPLMLFRAQRLIRVLPASAEDAPLDLTACRGPYTLSRTQCLWRTFFAKKEGELTATASQPTAVMLSPDGASASASSTRLKLVYIPSAPDSPPVRVRSISGKITSMTYFQVVPMRRLPFLEDWGSVMGSAPFQYSLSQKVFDLQVDRLSWQEERVTPEPEDRRYSYPMDKAQMRSQRETGVRNDSIAYDVDGKASKAQLTRYTTEVNVEFTVPHGNSTCFLPSFDSCFISRSYSLTLSIMLGPTHTNLTLKLPIQIGLEAAHGLQADGIGGDAGVLPDRSEHVSHAELQAIPSHDSLPGYTSSI